MNTAYASVIERRGMVNFPEPVGDKHYMLPFNEVEDLPERWRNTVRRMLHGIGIKSTAYLMVDEAFVNAGEFHRRPGVHVDGYWDDGLKCHQQGHTATPVHRYAPRHTPAPRHWGWASATFEEPEGIILASNMQGACGYVGEYAGPIGEGGDASKVNLEGLEVVNFPAYHVMAGNVCALHESLPVVETGWRQLVRINVPGWSPKQGPLS